MKKRVFIMSGTYIMPTIQKVNSTMQKSLLRADNTGYIALGGLVLTGATAAVKNKSIRKLHKPLAYITTILSFLHLGVILHNRNEWKKKHETMDTNA